MTDRQTDRQTSAPFHDMATRSGPHNKPVSCADMYSADKNMASMSMPADVELR